MGNPNDANPTDNGGGEISMSVEETNKLRASLGLPPLKAASNKDVTVAEEHRKRKREEESVAKTTDLQQRLQSAKERRQQQEVLNKMKTLGAADPDVDDVMAWVQKSRTQKQPSGTGRPKRRRAGAATDEQNIEDSASLAGMKLKLGAEDLEAGDEMIMTLEDMPILDEKGRLFEEEQAVLENVLIREDKQRQKAFKDSQRSAKPLWEEDGQHRRLLDKYDEEEEEALELNDVGAIEAAKVKRQDDIRAKLAAARQSAATGGDEIPANKGIASNGDYLTAEEMEAMKKPKKKKERKLKKKALTAEDLAALEAEAAAAGTENLGSRSDREKRVRQRAEEVVAAEADKRSRFEAALNKANYASLALRPESATNNALEGGDDEDEDFYKSLNKVRELALKKAERNTAVAQNEAEQNFAAQIAQRRDANTELAGVAGGLKFTDIGEFTRTITVKEEPAVGTVPIAPVAVKEDKVDVMEEDAIDAARGKDEEMGDASIPEEEETKKATGNDGGWSSWMPAPDTGSAAAFTHEEEKEEKPAGLPGKKGQQRRSYRRHGTEDDDSARASTRKPGEEAVVGGEANLGGGLGAALAFLKERGELERPVEWAGRTKDSRDSYFTRAMGGYKDVYSGGRAEDQLALDVEVALTRKDEFGRILTPKEAFRQLSHQFHGIKPSQNSREKRAKQVAKELAQRRAATGAEAGDALTGLKAVQEKAAAPYVVLSGTVKPGQRRDGYGADERDMPPPPSRPAKK